MSTPYKFDAARREEYLDLLRDGTRRMAAARACNINIKTVERAMRVQSGEHAGNLSEFGRAVHLAEREANELVEDALYQAAVSGNVKAAEVWLYNRMPESWRDQRQLRAELTGAGGGPIESRDESIGDYVRRTIQDPRKRAAAVELLGIEDDYHDGGEDELPAGAADAGAPRQDSDT